MTAPSSYLRTLREGQTSRRLGVAKVLRETPDATNIELAKIFDVDRDTIAEDRKFLMSQVNQDTKTEMQLYRDDQLARCEARRQELVDLRKRLVDHLIKPEDAVDLHLKILDREKDNDEFEAKLTGTAAPTRAENVNLHGDLENVGPYRQFVLASRGLDAEQVERLLTMAREMPRKPFVQVAPPKSSPLWDVPQLTEGTE
jgi:hypothetical protein